MSHLRALQPLIEVFFGHLRELLHLPRGSVNRSGKARSNWSVLGSGSSQLKRSAPGTCSSSFARTSAMALCALTPPLSLVMVLSAAPLPTEPAVYLGGDHKRCYDLIGETPSLRCPPQPSSNPQRGSLVAGAGQNTHQFRVSTPALNPRTLSRFRVPQNNCLVFGCPP